MDINELRERLRAIDRSAALEKKMAMYEYVRKNAKYKIGDILTDGAVIIQVAEIKFQAVEYQTGPDTVVDVVIFYLGTKLSPDHEPSPLGVYECVYEKNASKFYGI